MAKELLLLICVVAIAITIPLAWWNTHTKPICQEPMNTMVKNTIIACNWCEQFLENYNGSLEELVEKYGVAPAICMGRGTCEACVRFYRAYHNLTFDEFPTYCWRSDEGMPCIPR
ncbi:hypothetical protein [Archaeoglobus profundus]|uniref:Uncharacterized protein n=1 Tax=Archaeoglobus profundus (strain DSM 5631 / JCM 9629 / NBRC 100127 / Av18) TaxID=572546 RepID=D2RF58_ARCPA|nr:hypothetical protein [Archaeoglobus profundus]ADB58752.1 hypothetical protein Arcpr_1706 [Archaeoglobus profundus DSM 5631]